MVWSPIIINDIIKLNLDIENTFQNEFGRNMSMTLVNTNSMSERSAIIFAIAWEFDTKSLLEMTFYIINVVMAWSKISFRYLCTSIQ